MAKLKLPEQLKAWKVASQPDDVNGNAVYKVTKKEIDGSVTNALLTVVSLEGEDYNDDKIEYLLNESDFIQSIIDLGKVSNYIAVATDENERKSKFNLFIVTEDIPKLSDVMQNKEMSEKEVVDFGLQMSEQLETLEENKIFHGNIKPSNIYVTPNNRYKLGGFIDAESKVNDLTYVAPEIQRNESADFTTDIYSLGLVMYAMSNNGKLPFEGEGVDPKDAMVKRFEGETVPAPKNGSEKLKSVIVIACQPQNSNRWKNAGNLKNALNAIKAEIAEDEEAKANIIAPETTDFDGNVFENDNKDDRENTAKTAAAGAAVAGAAAAGAVAAGISNSDKSEPDADIKDDVTSDIAPEFAETEVLSQDSPAAPKDNEVKTPEAVDDNEIDNRVFDDYKLETKVFNLKDAISSGEKDYGDYFEEPEVKEEPQNFDVKDDSSLEDYTVFEQENTDEDKPKKSKKGLVAAIIIGVIVLLALLAAFGFIAVKKGLFGGVDLFGGSNQETTAESTLDQETTAAATTAQATTQQPTTAPATQKATEATVKNLIRVVGEPYEVAKQMLEAEGFIVQEGEYYYDDFYYEGNVISQYPSEYTDVEAGSVITLNISLGPENPKESSESEDDSDDDSSDYSSSVYNTSYLSQDEVEDMDRSELNMALNEIYARRGRIFTNPELNAYFSSQSWYTPKYNEAEFAQNVVFNDYEERNINLILNEQSKRGYR